MADLWERVTGNNLEADPAAGHDKIAIHAFWGMISEWDRGYETQANVLAAFNIQPGDQTAQASSIKSHINAAPNKTDFIRICKDWSYTGEATDPTAPETSKYHVWASFETRMGDIVTDQGGTDPTP